jgi:site-specific DNA-methyltransferase (adenine-specific)
MDCLEGMRRLPDSCIDLTVTSPPYDNLRDYNNEVTWNFEKFKEIAKELFRITKPGGVVVWVVGDATIKRSETGTSFRQALYFKEIGFNIHDTMIYQKNAFPFPDKTRYAQVFEYMFVLSKGKPNTTNIIRVPTKEANRIKNKKSYQRLPNGETVPMKYETGKSERNKENVWVYEVGYNKTTKDKEAFQHPAMFPEALAQDHIISWSNEGDLVLDPFMGSGTTAKMALLNNRHFIGFEISKEYCKIANERISKIQPIPSNKKPTPVETSIKETNLLDWLDELLGVSK